MASLTTINLNCPVCDEATTLTCGTCNQVSYCSVECKETDATAHDNICPLWDHFDSTPPLAPLAPGGTKFCRILWFPDDDNLPVFTWREVVNDPSMGKRPEFVTTVGTDKVKYNDPELDTNPLTGKKLRHRIMIVNDRAWMIKKLPVNPSVLDATAGQDREEYHRTWYGPVIAYCGKFNAEDACTEIEDMDLVDYSHVVAQLMTPSQLKDSYEQLNATKIHAVRIASGTAAKAGQEIFKAVKLPLTHPAFKRKNQSLASMSVLVGKPLHFARTPASEPATAVNEVVLDMLTISDEEDERYGTTSEKWDDATGDVLVFYRDHSPLTVDTVKEYLRYCQEMRGRL